MAWAYFDTSALVKRYVMETGRREVLRLLRVHDVVTSVLLPIEMQSAFRRRVREGTLDSARLPGIMERLSADRDYWTLVALADEVLGSAERLVAAHPLRTLDALHVASAQLFGSRIGAPGFLFVSADIRQVSAAAAVGLAVKHITS